MKKLLLLLLWSFTVTGLKAQEVLWASKVLEYSSYANDAQYSPKNRFDQILGTPSVYPQMTESPCAWQPGGSDFGEDYIKVGFDKAIDLKQLVIVENKNSGGVARIFGYGVSGKEYLLFQYSGAKQTNKPRFWRVFPEEVPPERINAVKLLVVHRLAPGTKQIDAIAISDSDEFVQFEINLAEDFQKETRKINLGTTVNSVYDEVAPIISPDGKTLYFTRMNHPENVRDNAHSKNKNVAQDIWLSRQLPSGEWSEAVNLGDPINTDEDNAAAAAHDNSLYILNVYLPDKKQKPGLSVTHYRNESWTFPQEVKIEGYEPKKEGNTGKITTEFATSPDREVMIIGYYGFETAGSNDLYVSFRKPDGTYSRPRNMGKVINTADKEGTPFLSADKKTLFFNSKGHPGYGDADIFMSRRLDDSWTNWSQPVNLGPEINSTKWDGYFSIPIGSDYAYLSSQNASRSDQDIFKIELFESIKPEARILLSLSAINQETKEQIGPLKLTVTVPDSTGALVPVLLESDSTGILWKGILEVNKPYHVQLSAAGFLSMGDSLFFTAEDSRSGYEKIYELIPVKEGQKMVMENLFFDQGKYQIKENSFEELQRLVGIMKEYPSMRILLEGHTDNQGDFTLNVQLAENRVNAVKAYLIETGGISEDRIETKSWGPLKPVSSNSTPETRKKNRRVEFTILKM